MFLLSDYDYDLPEALIAQQPAEKRDLSRLLHLHRRTGRFSHHAFLDICDLLSPSDVLVVNNTEVIPARLMGRKETGGRVEVLVLDYHAGGKQSACQRDVEYKCLIKASKRLKNGAVMLFESGLKAEVLNFQNGIYTVRFICDDRFEEHLYEIGRMPLPPYIKRTAAVPAPCDDHACYQTVYASQKGAVAAPTAGLHFSEGLLEKIQAGGIQVVAITLHVGYGTFLPVRVTDIREHCMHSEWYSISEQAAAAINAAKAAGRRIVAVGTTSVRTLEYASDETGKIPVGSGSCDLFIYPGYRFKVVEAMVTNFHLPQSTLLMLVSAFAGRDNILKAYQAAVEQEYRFFSYGDAMLID